MGGDAGPTPSGRERLLSSGGSITVAVTGAVFGVLALQGNSDFNTLKDSGADQATLQSKKDSVDSNALVADATAAGGSPGI